MAELISSAYAFAPIMVLTVGDLMGNTAFEEAGMMCANSRVHMAHVDRGLRLPTKLIYVHKAKLRQTIFCA